MSDGVADRCDYAIVGGGIAGLAIAEMFARSGFKVALIERDPQLCQEASASQHGWFHMGSLYSIFPQNQFLRTMVGGVEDLKDFYSGFPDMNLRVADGGRLMVADGASKWFRDEPIEYIVSARNDPDFDMRRWSGARNYAEKTFFLLTWELAIKQFISRHQRFHKHDWASATPASHWIPRAGFTDYSREVISKPHHPGIKLDVDTHFRIVGYDRPMRVNSIIGDLARALLGAGGRIVTGEEVVGIDKVVAARRLTLRSGRTIEARQVIVAAGRWLSGFLPRRDDVKVVGSPLLVAYPAVSTQNFVRMTPFVERSINHLHHEIDGRRYSVIGGGYSADPEDAAGVLRATEKLKEIATAVFPALARAEMVDSYLGYKTEMAAKSGERNYQYFIRELEPGLHAVVPGKFSLAFSLAVNTLRRLTGRPPKTGVVLAAREAAAPYVGMPQHARLVHQWIGRSQALAESRVLEVSGARRAAP